jgi:predicted MFS family arabinose efflux permease
MDCPDTVAVSNADLATRTTAKDWLAVASIAAAAFATITTEFLPIGMLDAIAQSFGVSIGRAGLAVAVPGLAATFAAPALIVVARSIDQRRILQALTVALIISGIVSAFAQHFYVLLAGRILLGFAIGGFWTLALSAVRRLVRERDGDKALAMLSAAISFGTVLGVPAGSIGSRLFGWHAVFLRPALLAACSDGPGEVSPRAAH